VRNAEKFWRFKSKEFEGEKQTEDASTIMVSPTPIFPGKNLKIQGLNGTPVPHSALLSEYQIRGGVPSFWGKLYSVWNQIFGRNWQELSLDTVAMAHFPG
jgi:hypothetical protein